MSDPIEILERRLNAVLDQEASTKGLHFFCQIGGHDTELGIITLQVSGSGNVLLSWRHDYDNVDLWSLRFTDDDYHQFLRLFLTHRFWTLNPSRRDRDGDEINVHLRVSAQDVGTYEGIQFWSDDMDEYRVLRKLITPLGKLIQNISHEEIGDDDLQDILYT